MTAIACAISGRIPLEVFQAMSDSDEEAKAMHEQHEAEIAAQQAVR